MINEFLIVLKLGLNSFECKIQKERMQMAYTNPIPILPDDINPQSDTKAQNEIKENYPRYDDVYFAFIDVLGFKQTFDDNRGDSNKEFAQGYEDVFKYYSQLLRNAKFSKVGITHAGQTSDSLYFYTDRIDFLAEFIKIYLHFSLYSMGRKVFFRGGIAKGCLFINEPYQFYGDCVIKAYLLEEKIAKLPRIAMDCETYEELKKTDIKDALIHDEKNGRYYLNPFVQTSRSELAFITNLDADDIQLAKREDVEAHIVEGKKRFEFDEKNYQKYQFLYEQIKKSDIIFE